MTQEDKELLLKDLCGRLPYGVKVKILDPDVLPYETSDVGTIVGKEHLDDDLYTIRCKREGWILEVNRHFIPYLRRMSSMTEEEKKELENYLSAEIISSYSGLNETLRAQRHTANFLYSRHLDVLGLIEKKLALEAPEGMYKTE